MVTMKDVAERAGVSVATVSNVITGKRNVSPEVQKTVLNAISELDYHVNMIARGLKTQRTNTIGVVFADVTKLFYNGILRGIMAAAGAQGYNINILSSGYDFEREKQMIATLRGNHVDAIILDTCVNHQQSQQWGREIGATGVPVVSIMDTLSEDVSCLTVDCVYWSSRITQHLIDQGRKNIFYISGPPTLSHQNDRLEGYKRALRENGMPVREELIATHDFLSGSAYDTVQQALANGLKFDAVQASNDQAAIGAIKALKENGIRVPDQVAVTGFDDLFPGTLVNPAVTTVHVPQYTTGYKAVTECIRRINEPEAAPKRESLDSRLIIRGSTCKQAEADWDLDNW